MDRCTMDSLPLISDTFWILEWGKDRLDMLYSIVTMHAKSKHFNIEMLHVDPRSGPDAYGY